MPVFSAPDGTALAYRVTGEGAPVVCLPGGPMQDSRYLGDLGGLSEHRTLIMLDLRGTGRSAIPEDTASYRCDRLVADVEALRSHLGLDRLDLLAHSAGANLAALYAARYPQRLGKLALITPSTLALGIAATGQMRREAAQLREAEPWYATAAVALEAIISGQATDDTWEAITPFFYGRWDAAAQAHHATETAQRNEAAADAFRADGAFDPDATRAALASFRGPALLVAGEVDLNPVPQVVAQYAELFPDATVAVQPEAGHFPWLDDAGRFVAITAAFLG
jgi:pimeloyl-ACP methyl ester carboxylesterase